MKPFLVLLLVGASLAGQQPHACCNGTPPATGKPLVELRGSIGQVQLAMGQGMPWLEVKTGKETVKVWLGSMRFLIAENFNPKAGQEVALKGFRTAGEVLATEVTLPAEKKTIKLRDAEGWPLWSGGHRHRGGEAKQ